MTTATAFTNGVCTGIGLCALVWLVCTVRHFAPRKQD